MAGLYLPAEIIDSIQVLQRFGQPFPLWQLPTVAACQVETSRSKRSDVAVAPWPLDVREKTCQGSNAGSMRYRGMGHTTRKAAIYLMTAAVVATTTLPAAAGGFGFSAAPVFSFDPGAPREYPYPAEPQYQYPIQSQRTKAVRRCPRGQALFQGTRRIVRPVY
jgi:hypothetical protein